MTVKLTTKQRKFVAEYAIDGNATRAAIQAGYSPNCAATIGCENLMKHNVAAAIEETLNKHVVNSGLQTDMVLRSIVRELMFDPADLFTAEGAIRSIHDIPPDARKCLTSIEVDQMGGQDAPAYITRLKWASASSARDQAARILGLNAKDNAQKGEAAAMQVNELEAARRIAFMLYKALQNKEKVIEQED